MKIQPAIQAADIAEQAGAFANRIGEHEEHQQRAENPIPLPAKPGWTQAAIIIVKGAVLKVGQIKLIAIVGAVSKEDER